MPPLVDPFQASLRDWELLPPMCRAATLLADALLGFFYLVFEEVARVVRLGFPLLVKFYNDGRECILFEKTKKFGGISELPTFPLFSYGLLSSPLLAPKSIAVVPFELL